METVPKHLELLYARVKDYTDTSIELYKLNAIDITADVVSSLVSRIVLILMFSLFTLFVNIAISLLIGNLIGSYYLGFLIISGFYLIITILIYFFSNKFIKTPIANLVIAKLLTSGRKNTETKFGQDENL